MSGFDIESSLIERLLEPMPSAEFPCGPNLEHDPEFLELDRTCSGHHGSQFAEAIAPDWRVAHALALQLLERTRDVRVCLPLAQASVHLQGYSALPAALQLLRGLLDKFWDHLHPVPEDADDPSRVNALAPLYAPGGLIDDLQRCTLYKVREFGNLRPRDIDIALGGATAQAEEKALTGNQLMQMLAETFARDPELASLPGRVVTEVEALSATLTQRAEPLYAGLLEPLLAFAVKLRTNVAKARGNALTVDDGESGQADGAGATLSGAVRNRIEALRAIDMVCDYFDRTEPTHPAPLLLRRAKRLINQNFWELMKELAPEALPGLSSLMGVSMDDMSSDRPSSLT